MEQIVNYQLQRSAGGSHKLLQLVPLLPLVERLRDTLLKVHADRRAGSGVAIDPQVQFRGDERDFLEIAGNVMDNACKYGRGRVWVSAAGGGSSRSRWWWRMTAPVFPPANANASCNAGRAWTSSAPATAWASRSPPTSSRATAAAWRSRRAPRGGARVVLRFEVV